jgi:hypothetical protein
MKIKEILEIEKSNEECIHLFKEGIFWRCYEYSAWRFVNNIKDYKVFKKHVKAVGKDIVYLGFPDSVLDTIIESYNKNIISDSQICLDGFSKKEGFESWKAEIENQLKS